jgi:hypothetical protein
MKTECVEREREREMIRRGEEVLEVGRRGIAYIYLFWISMPLICCLIYSSRSYCDHYIFFDK